MSLLLPLAVDYEARYPGVLIHPTAVVSDDCEIGGGTRIWSGAVVRAGTKLGKKVSVSANTILEGCEIGDGTHINPFVHMGPGIVVGRGCFICAQVVICNDGWPTVNRSDNGGWFPEPGWITVKIEDFVSIGTGAIVMPGVKIGEGALVAAQACVTYDLPAGHLWTRDGRVKRIQHNLIRRMRSVA